MHNHKLAKNTFKGNKKIRQNLTTYFRVFAFQDLHAGLAGRLAGLPTFVWHAGDFVWRGRPRSYYNKQTKHFADPVHSVIINKPMEKTCTLI